MELSFLELQKRDVINISDGKCLGKIIDLTLSFPKGIMTGIVVPGKRLNFITRIFSRSELFISVDNIIKIGNDVILVNVRCGETCAPNVDVARRNDRPPKRPNHCPPTCEEIFGDCHNDKCDRNDDYQNL